MKRTTYTWAVGNVTRLDEVSIVTITGTTRLAGATKRRNVTFISHADGRDWFIAPNGDHVRCDMVDEIQDPAVQDALDFLVDYF